jgi:hypothetical protein
MSIESIRCMKKFCLWLALAGCAMPSLAGTDVGISVGISQPGMYGRIDIGTVGVQPVLVYPQPMVVVANPVPVVQRPIYLHVPPGHAKNWRKHCGYYNACAQPVYFVQEDWYQRHYASGPGKSRGNGKGHGKHDD